MTMPWIPATPDTPPNPVPARRWWDGPGSGGGGGSGGIKWWDGTSRQSATIYWWDGTAKQACTVLGFWDGTTIQPITP